jgi:hypothetical protein
VAAGAGDDIGDVIEEVVGDADLVQVGLHEHEVLGGDDLLEADVVEVAGVEALDDVGEQALFDLAGRVGDVELHEEAVELGLGEG